MASQEQPYSMKPRLEESGIDPVKNVLIKHTSQKFTPTYFSHRFAQDSGTGSEHD